VGLFFEDCMQQADTNMEDGPEPGASAGPIETDGLEPGAEVAESPAEDDRELEDVEYEGRVYQTPKALRDAFMRHADYTRKTQELADERRALEAERVQTLEALETRAGLAALDQKIAAIEGLDWDTLAAEEPQRAQHLHAHLAELSAAREGLAGDLAAFEAERSHGERMAQARRVAEGQAALKRDLPDWSPELAGRLASFAVEEFGVTPQELAQVHDPLLVRLLHAAYVGANAARSNRQAQRHLEAQASRPAATVGGRAGASKDPNRMSTEEWMRHRNAQLRRQR
jgi:hypothetical protein